MAGASARTVRRGLRGHRAGQDRAAGWGQAQDRSARRRAVLRLLMIDALHAVRVPTSEEEALRDVIGAREAVRGDLMRARQRLSKLLLRHEVRYEDTASAWTVAHRSWLTSLDLGQRGAQITLLEYLGAIDAIVIRRDALEKTIAELIPGSPWEQTVARLRCLDRHALRGRLVRRGRRVRPVSEGRPADELCRPDPIRGHQRRETPPRRHHQDRVPARPPAAGRSRAGTTAARPRRDRRSAAANTDSPPTSSRSPGRPSDACTTSGNDSTLNAANAARSSRSPSPASSPASAGHSPTPTDLDHCTTPAEEAAGAWSPRESIRDLK